MQALEAVSAAASEAMAERSQAVPEQLSGARGLLRLQADDG
jgi:hypothetical protein